MEQSVLHHRGVENKFEDLHLQMKKKQVYNISNLFKTFLFENDYNNKT